MKKNNKINRVIVGLLILIIGFGLLGSIGTMINPGKNNNMWNGGASGWYSGLVTGVTLLLMYTTLYRSKKEDAKGEVIIFRNNLAETIDFVLYNKGQKKGAFRFVGIMTEEGYEKYRNDELNLNKNYILIDPAYKDINGQLIILSGQDVSKTYHFEYDVVKDFVNRGEKSNTDLAYIVFEGLNKDKIVGKIRV